MATGAEVGLVEAMSSADSNHPANGDLQTVRDQVQSLPISEFNESGSNDLQGKLSIAEFERKAAEISQTHGLDKNTMQSILDGKFAEVNKQVIKTFEFHRGNSGSSVRGLVATCRRADGTMDIGHAAHSLKFSLAPEMIKHKKVKRKCFGLKKKTKKWYEARPRNLSENDITTIGNYCQHKLMEQMEQLKGKAQSIGN
jgi:hypothetical protein